MTLRVFSILLIILFAVLSLQAEQQRFDVVTTWGLSVAGVEQGKVWQMISYALLHGSWLHVLLNAGFLFVLGNKAEEVFGGFRAWSVLVLGVVLGGLFQLLLGLWIAEVSSTVLVGISGGVMALLLALTTHAPYGRVQFLRIRWGNLGMGCLVSALFLLLLYPALGIPVLASFGEKVEWVLGMQLGEVSHACHLGGGLVGWITGRFFLR